MILSELIAKLGELYLSQGDVLVHVGDSTIGWDVSDVVVGNVPDYVLLVAGPLMNDLTKQQQMINNYQQENARLRNRIEELDKEIARTQYVQQSIINNWTSIDTNYVDIT